MKKREREKKKRREGTDALRVASLSLEDVSARLLLLLLLLHFFL